MIEVQGVHTAILQGELQLDVAGQHENAAFGHVCNAGIREPEPLKT